MCGICGFARREPIDPPQDKAVLNEMCSVISHRGPDAMGQRAFGDRVFLGHLRLSIIDLSDAANQPLCNEDGTVWIVFNGEIYNFQPLREQLLKKGHVLRSSGDTEVLVHLYEEYGTDMLSLLNGMYAFAIWDTNKQRLFCARDNFGIKPLYYCENEDGFTFGSEIKALLARPEVKPEVNPLSLWQSLSFRYVPGNATLFRSIKKVLPGHFLLWQPDESVKQIRWYDIAEERASATTTNVTADEVHETLAKAVDRQMVADVPVGSFLSGGLDSSLITALMCRAEDPMRTVHTYTVGYQGSELPPNSPVDRRKYIEDFAKRYPVETRFIDPILRPGENLGLDTLQRIVWHLEEPVFDSAVLNAYRVAELAKRNETKVLLCGHGADEVFGGYRRHKAAGLLQNTRYIPGALLKLFGKAISNFPTAYRHAHFLNVASQSPPEDLINISILNLLPDTRAHLHSSFLNGYTEADATRYHRQIVDTYQGRDLTDTAILLDQLTYMVDQNLLYMDKLSMAYSLETRVPYLDLEVVKLGATIASGAMVRRGRLKAILYDAAAPLLPASIIDRPKSGFGIYVNSWWSQSKPDWYADILNAVRERGWYEREMLASTEKRAEAGHTDSSELLFAVILSEIWAQQFLI